MNSNKYTLDRYEGGFAVLLLKEDESLQKIVPEETLKEIVNEGELLEITFNADGTINDFTILENETKEMKGKVADLLYKLKNK